jgi:nucleotide-binding universal stress UspA family protein
MSIQKILVPVDFSDCSKNALSTGIRFADAFDAKLIILHAFQIPAAHGEPGGAAISAELSEEVENDAMAQLKELEEDFPSLKYVEYTIELVHSYPTDAIQKACENNQIDLIIMGTKGASGVEEKLIGSNTFSTIKNNHLPVLSLPTDKQIENLADIAFAGDYQKIENKEVFEVLLDISNFFNSTIHILHVNEEEGKINADEAFEARKFKQYFKGISHNYHFIKNADIESGIYDYIESHKISLLAMIPRKHRVFERIFKESLTKKVACHAKVPLLTLS